MSNIVLVTFLIHINAGYLMVFILCSGLLYVVIREKVLRQIGIKGFFEGTSDVRA